MDIGGRIRAARRLRGMTQEELARRAGMSLKGMGDIERGAIPDPHYSSLHKIAGGLGVSVRKLLEEEPVLSGKAEAPKAGQQPGVPESESGTGQWSLTEFGKWRRLIGDFNYLAIKRLERLPEPPSGEEWLAERAWIKDTVLTGHGVMDDLEKDGVLEALSSYVDAVANNEPLPDDVRREALGLNDAVIFLGRDVLPKARMWESRCDEHEQLENLEAKVPEWEAEASRSPARSRPLRATDHAS